MLPALPLPVPIPSPDLATLLPAVSLSVPVASPLAWFPVAWPAWLLQSAPESIGNHTIEVAETLIQVGRFLVIFLAARTLAELMVRLQLPTILGELQIGRAHV